MFLPYRVKNPIKHFPIMTVSIIVLNVIIYVFTAESNMLGIRPEVVKDYAYALGATPWYNFISAAFLHAGPMHIIGNMVFFWVFGPPVEDRLGPWRFFVVYMLAGLGGDLCQAALGYAEGGRPTPIIGASGCIFGIMGAYWYIYSWSTVCVAYFIWIVWIWYGVWEVAAFWVVAYYFVYNVAIGALSRSLQAGGGVANFAHVGGAVVGLASCLLLRTRRDSAQVSEAKAVQSDTRDLTMVPLHGLQSMLAETPDDPELIRALVRPAMAQGAVYLVEDAMSKVGPAMIDKDPGFVAYYLTILRGRADIYQPAHMLRLAGLLERTAQAQEALQVYQLIAQKYPTAQDAETALYRMSLCYWRTFRDAESARQTLRRMAADFPTGPMIPFGKSLWNEIAQAR